MRPLSLTAALLLSACNGTDLVAPSGVAANCGTAAPTVTVFELSDATTGETPIVGALVRAEDVDGDLHWIEARLFWDDEVDGEIDTTLPYTEAYGPRGDLDCAVEFTEVSFRVSAAGNPPAGRELEFGVVVLDDMGNMSDVSILEFETPE